MNKGRTMKKMIILSCLAVCLNAEVGNLKGENSSCTFWFDKLAVNNTSMIMAIQDEDTISQKVHIYEGLFITREMLTKCKTDSVISFTTKYRTTLQEHKAALNAEYK